MLSVSPANGQTVSLAESDGGTLTRIRMSLGWDAAPKKGFFGSRQQTIDFNASVLLVDAQEWVLDAVSYGQLRSRAGSASWPGDSLPGKGDGDDESIRVDLTGVPADVTTLVFTVSSFTAKASPGSRTGSAGLVHEFIEGEVTHDRADG